MIYYHNFVHKNKKEEDNYADSCKHWQLLEHQKGRKNQAMILIDPFSSTLQTCEGRGSAPALWIKRESMINVIKKPYMYS